MKERRQLDSALAAPLMDFIDEFAEFLGGHLRCGFTAFDKNAIHLIDLGHDEIQLEILVPGFGWNVSRLLNRLQPDAVIGGVLSVCPAF